MRNEKGQVLIETALILPLLFVLIFGMVDFSRAMYMKNTLGNAARTGARAATVTSSLSPMSSPASLFQATGEPAASMQRALPEGIPRDATVQYQLQAFDSHGQTVTGTAKAGNQVRVILTYPSFPMVTPFYKVLALLTGAQSADSSSVTIAAEASMRYE